MMKRDIVMTQQYNDYIQEDHTVWSILYERQMKKLPFKATSTFLTGLECVGFQQEIIPDFREVNARLRKLTGWELFGVKGIVPNREFFELLSDKKFPATTWLRKMQQLDYLEEPDMFHDVFAHVPLLSNQPFCDFLQGLSTIALHHIKNETIIELISRIYWYTVEFGLIRESGGLKIYGAGILSSNGETDYCLKPELPHIDFDIEWILNTHYIKEKYQEQYFVINNYNQLFNSLNKIERQLLSYV